MGAPVIKRPGALGVRHGGPPLGALLKGGIGAFGLGWLGSAPTLAASQIKVLGS
jgi:hypothetical protein